MTESEVRPGVDGTSLALLSDALPGIFFTACADAPPDEVPWPDVVHPLDTPRLGAAWSKAVRTQTAFELKVRLRGDDGGYWPSMLRGVPLRDEAGRVLCWVVAKHEVERDSPSRESINPMPDLLRAICNTATDAIFVKDLEGHYVYVNPTCAKMFGAPPRAVVGSTDDTWFGPEVGARLREEDRAVLAAEGAVYRDEDLELTTGLWHFSTIKAPYLDDAGNVLGIVGIARDVSAIRREHLAVREERDMYATIAVVVPGAIVSIRMHADGRFEMPYATLAILDLFGASPDELERDPTIMERATHPDDRDRVRAALVQSAADLSPFRCECRITHPRRGEIWVEIMSGPLHEPDGSTLWHGFMFDITSRKQVEHELRDKKDLLEGIAQSSPGAIYTLRRSTEGHLSFAYVSTAMSDIYGVSLEELVRNSRLVREMVHPDDQRHVRETLGRSAVKLSAWHCEYRVLNPRRGIVWVEGQATPTRGADGATSWNGVLLDVTERKHADAAIRAERDRFAAISESAPGAIYSYRERADGTVEFPYFSPSIMDIVGVPAEELSSQPAMAFSRIHPDDLGHVMATSLEASTELTPWRDEFRVLHPVRGEIWVEGHSRPRKEADGSKVWHGIFVDVSDRRRSEERLRASEATLRAVVETVPDTLILIGRDGKIQFINRLLPGYEMADVVGTPVFDLVAPPMREGVMHTMELVFATGEVQSYEAANVPPEPGAGTLWFNTRVGPVVHDGDVVALTLASTDITERKRAENAVRASEERYRTLVEVLPDAVFVHTKEKITFYNAAFARLMSADRAQLIGRTPLDVLHPDHHATLAKRLLRMHETQEAVPPLEASVVALDGTRRYVSVVATPIVDHDEPGVLVVLHDLTDRRKLEEQFRQAHKMEAFGQLAGGVAHDFNNLLTVILSESALVLSSLPPDAPAAASLIDIQKAGERAAGLTRQLLAFSRRTVLEPKVLDLNITVREIEKLLQRLIGEDIHLTTTLAPSLSRVHVDPSQLAQVLMNLSVNARDAMPKGGKLEIGTANLALDETRARSLGLSPGSFVKLSVRDTGTGMPPDVRARIFQPFFTTKPVGQGTGLGLAVVHGIVTQSGGAIEVDTEVGRGTLYDIFFPASRAASSPSIAAAASPAAHASGTVLVVEDDDAVRRLAKRVLSARGYTVLLARHGVEALSMLEVDRVVVDLVVTDVVMPNMDGRELGERLRASLPRVKLLYVSGYTNDVLVRRGLQSEEVEFLAKPYTPASLSGAVARALERR